MIFVSPIRIIRSPELKADSLVNTVAESILAEYDKNGQTAVETKSPEKITELEKSKIEDQSWKSNSSSFKLIQCTD